MKFGKLTLAATAVIVLALPGLVSATLLTVNFSGEYTFGTGTFSGTVILDPSNPPLTLFESVNTSVSEGIFLNAAGDPAQLLGAQNYDQGFDSGNPVDDFAIWRLADIDADGLLGDRLFFLDFSFFGGFDNPDGLALATEFICPDAGCTFIDDTTFGRQGVATFSSVPVPEPGTLGLLGAGLIGLAWRRRAQWKFA